MSDIFKKRQLLRYKTLATSLFVLMAIMFVATSFLKKDNPSLWIDFLRAFSEAAMVGALADWFAVTALFHYPFGVKIPHTNLIEKSKEKIGDNLGEFVVDNFLSPQNIRPYIQKLKISVYVSDWLSKEKNKHILLTKFSSIIITIINKLDDKILVDYINKKTISLRDNVKLNSILGNGINYLLEKNDHQKLITYLSSQIKNYILDNKAIVSEKVEEESFFFIPISIDRKIAEKITLGLSNYFREVEENSNHPLRDEITNKIFDFSHELKTENRWEQKLENIKSTILQEEELLQYSNDIWVSIKYSIIKELSNPDSTLLSFVKKNIEEFSFNLKNDVDLQHKIDHWLRITAYKYFLRNRFYFGNLISSTVGGWEGKELSEKLELEVGKDLQFIRINGTIVGGLVGLLIYAISLLFS